MSVRELDAAIARARETLVRKRTRTMLRGLDARDRDEIQSRLEKIVREINAAGGNKLGIQGDLRREASIEVWDLLAMGHPILGISVETGKVKLR